MFYAPVTLRFIIFFSLFSLLFFLGENYTGDKCNWFMTSIFMIVTHVFRVSFRFDKLRNKIPPPWGLSVTHIRDTVTVTR